jgi:hypothetical protein
MFGEPRWRNRRTPSLGAGQVILEAYVAQLYTRKGSKEMLKGIE